MTNSTVASDVGDRPLASLAHDIQRRQTLLADLRARECTATALVALYAFAGWIKYGGFWYLVRERRCAPSFYRCNGRDHLPVARGCCLVGNVDVDVAAAEWKLGTRLRALFTTATSLLRNFFGLHVA
ncbi:hypothetical protein B0H14DRAFT_3773617 [Mycena olivaceomarginata]|nr:hypothetical protein B0H14DRAFT_3773617 [Mycena olivaceomarginata]